MMQIVVTAIQTSKMFATMPAAKLKEGQPLRSRQTSIYSKAKKKSIISNNKE